MVGRVLSHSTLRPGDRFHAHTRQVFTGTYSFNHKVYVQGVVPKLTPTFRGGSVTANAAPIAVLSWAEREMMSDKGSPVLYISEFLPSWGSLNPRRRARGGRFSLAGAHLPNVNTDHRCGARSPPGLFLRDSVGQFHSPEGQITPPREH